MQSAFINFVLTWQPRQNFLGKIYAITTHLYKQQSLNLVKLDFRSVQTFLREN